MYGLDPARLLDQDWRMSGRENEAALAFEDDSDDERRRDRRERLPRMARDPQIKARALATEEAIKSGSPPPDRAAVDSLQSR